MKFLKKYHKWISIIFSLFILMFSVSGIILNHRELFSGIDISRKFLPKQYEYTHWNDAAVKNSIKIGNDSLLIYGDVGIWLCDSTYHSFRDFNSGFAKGIDNRKISKMLITNDKQIIAGTFFGLFRYNRLEKKWNKIQLPVDESRISDIIQVKDTLNILTRSLLLQTKDLKSFKTRILPKPVDYDNKIGLFKTLWVIHSGEIYGTAGKIIVDVIGIILAFLTISGFILFYNKIILKKNKISEFQHKKLIVSNKFNLKWHNKIGWITAAILLITATTGIFLRPPFLIPIANVKVEKIPFSTLDTPNPWFDKLRRILYDSENQKYIIATLDGIYYSDDNFNSNLKKFDCQPPASVMGINVFEKIDSDKILVGSFEGLFLWQPDSNLIIDYITKEYYVPKNVQGPPIGQFMISGMLKNGVDEIICFDYNFGAFSLNPEKSFVSMPKIIENQPISLWNCALEFHTGRIFQFMLRDFYILIVPLVGLAVIFILISGFIVWYKKFK